MKSLLESILTIFVINLMLCSIALAQIQSEGACSIEKNLPETRIIAIQRALSKAVLSEVDRLVKLDMIEFEKLKKDMEITEFVSDYKVISENRSLNMMQVILDVELIHEKLVDYLIDQGYRKKFKSVPLIAVISLELHNDTPVKISLLKKMLENKLLKYNFRTASLPNVNIDKALQDQQFAVKIGRDSGADIILLAHSTSEKIEKGGIGKYISCHVEATLTAIRCDNTEILSSQTVSGSGLGVSERQARRRAYERFAPKAVEKITRSIFRTWYIAVSDGTVAPLPLTEASSSPEIRLFSPQTNEITDAQSVRLRGIAKDDTGISYVTIMLNGNEMATNTGETGIPMPRGMRKKRAENTDYRIDRAISLTVGGNEIKVLAVDEHNNRTEKIIKLYRNSAETERLMLLSPTKNESIQEEYVQIFGQAAGKMSAFKVSVNEQYMKLKSGLHFGRTEGKFGATVPVNQGQNLLEVIAKFQDGKEIQKYVKVYRDSSKVEGIPEIAIYEPISKSVTITDRTLKLCGEVLYQGVLDDLSLRLNGTEIANKQHFNQSKLQIGESIYQIYELDETLDLNFSDNKIELTAGYSDTLISKNIDVSVKTESSVQPDMIITSPSDGEKLRDQRLEITGKIVNVQPSNINVFVNGMKSITTRDLQVVSSVSQQVSDTNRDLQAVPVESQKGRHSESEIVFSKSVFVSPGQNLIRIVAKMNGTNLTAERKVTCLSSEYQVDSGNRYAVIIGISDYQDPDIPDLTFSRIDAQAVYDFLISDLGYSSSNVKLLLGEQATRTNIRSAIGSWLANSVDENDMVILFYSGHGGVEADLSGAEPDGNKYIIPYNGVRDDLFGTAIQNCMIANMLDRVRSKCIVFFVDCCYSGSAVPNLTGIRSIAKAELKSTSDAISQLSGRGRVVISASQADQVSFEVPEFGHGIFTYYLLQGLSGEADSNNDSQVMLISEIYPYLTHEVSKAAQSKGVNQNPVLMCGISGDMALTGD